MNRYKKAHIENEKVYAYGKMTFDTMMLSVDKWQKNKLNNYEVHALCRYFYHMVRESGINNTGMIAFKKPEDLFKDHKLIDDHYFKPERVAKFVMTRLKDFIDKNKKGTQPINEFFKFFQMCRSTIKMPKIYHDGFSKRTKNILTANTYSEEGLTLYDKRGNKYDDQSLNIPKYYTEWEEQWLNLEDPVLVEPLHSKRLTATLPMDFFIDI